MGKGWSARWRWRPREEWVESGRTQMPSNIQVSIFKNKKLQAGSMILCQWLPDLSAKEPVGCPDRSCFWLEDLAAPCPFHLALPPSGHLCSLSSMFTSCLLSWRYIFTFSKSPTEEALRSFFKSLSWKLSPSRARGLILALPLGRCEDGLWDSSFLCQDAQSFFTVVQEAVLQSDQNVPEAPNCPTCPSGPTPRLMCSSGQVLTPSWVPKLAQDQKWAGAMGWATCLRQHTGPSTCQATPMPHTLSAGMGEGGWQTQILT